MSYEKIIMLGKKMVSVIFKMMLIQIDFYVYKLETVCIVLCVLWHSSFVCTRSRVFYSKEYINNAT